VREIERPPIAGRESDAAGCFPGTGNAKDMIFRSKCVFILIPDLDDYRDAEPIYCLFTSRDVRTITDFSGISCAWAELERQISVVIQSITIVNFNPESIV
jgi:hypothetical protein